MTRCLVPIVALAVIARAAHADVIVRGEVVKIEATEIYVNLGRDRELTDGAPLRIKRAIKLVHPITKATVDDWIPIAHAQVTQAGSRLSRAVIGAAIDDIRVGDIAEVLVHRDAPPLPPPTPPPAAPRITDPVTAEVLEAFVSQTGGSLDARIAAWEGYLSTHPSSPFAAAIRADLTSLGELRDRLRPTTTGRREFAIAIEHQPPSHAIARRPLPVAFVLPRSTAVASAYLHYRNVKDRTYRRLLLTREHEVYLRGAIPADVVVAPGIAYFVEVTASDGRSGLAKIGSGQPVQSIAVTEPSVVLERFAAAPGQSSMRLTGEALDFANLDRRAGDRTDRVAVANVDFLYRIGQLVDTVGVGYGVLAGAGGFGDATYTMADPAPRSAFQFGYADVEFAQSQTVAVAVGGRLIAGVGLGGFGMGIEGRVRFGRARGTNLAVVGSTLQQVGFLADVRFATWLRDDLKLGVSVGATDQPNQGDIGVKLASELEYAATSHLSLLLRTSWQGRNTAHGGIGGGAGVGVSW